MVDMLLKALDRLIDLLRIREMRAQKRFDQIWKPTYNDLQVVHADYYTMFQKVHSLLSEGVKQGEPAASQSWDAAIQFIKQQRIALAPVRHSITALTKLETNETLLETLNEQERHFLSQVTAYIRINSLPDVVMSRSADLQHELERLARMDDTVAERVVFEDLDRRIDHLRRDWIDLSESFNALQIALIQQST